MDKKINYPKKVTPLSLFGKFLIDSRRVIFMTKAGRELDKWEAFDHGPDLTRVLKGESDLRARRYDIDEFLLLHPHKYNSLENQEELS